MTVRSTLFEFWQEKEKEWGRDITISEVSEATALSRDTITRLRDGKTSRFDGPVLSKLCEFFKAKPGPIPFLIFELESDEAGTSRGGNR